MKKYFITLCLSAIFGLSMAQDVTTYSVYDTNQSGDVTVSDVTEVVENVKKNVSAASTRQVVTAEELKGLFSTFLTKLEAVETRLSAIEAKVGIETPVEPNDPDEPAETHEAVDLGLSVKWATCNVGATSPEDYGDYYAWGETEHITQKVTHRIILVQTGKMGRVQATIGQATNG